MDMENENKVAVYCESDSVSIVYPAPNAELTFEEIIQKSVPQGIKYTIVSKSEIPINRLYRDAWIFQNEKIKVDVEKAKEIQKNNIRSVRDKIFKDKDIEYMRALELQDNSKISEIVEQKNKLRDVPNIVNSFSCDSTDPDVISNELSKVWDSSILGQNLYTK
jgi:hypothetical protein